MFKELIKLLKILVVQYLQDNRRLFSELITLFANARTYNNLRCVIRTTHTDVEGNKKYILEPNIVKNSYNDCYEIISITSITENSLLSAAYKYRMDMLGEDNEEKYLYIRKGSEVESYLKKYIKNYEPK